jgi:hypothetical protein
MAYLGEAEALAATLADAVSLLTQVVEQNMAIEVVVDQALCGLTLGETQMLAGHLDEACTLAEQALSISYAHKERGHQAYALRLLGDIAARREPPEVTQSERHYRQALDLAEELGMRPLQGHCHLGLGTLYATTAQRQQTQVELSKSIEMYRAMDMTLWLPQAETALAQTGQGERLARGIS